MHEWGDDWFKEHGDKLDRAMRIIELYVKSHCDYRISMKEKYGTIRYERLIPWIDSDTTIGRWKANQMLRKAMSFAVTIFPEIEKEITDDYDDEIYL